MNKLEGRNIRVVCLKGGMIFFFFGEGGAERKGSEKNRVVEKNSENTCALVATLSIIKVQNLYDT